MTHPVGGCGSAAGSLALHSSVTFSNSDAASASLIPESDGLRFWLEDGAPLNGPGADTDGLSPNPLSTALATISTGMHPGTQDAHRTTIAIRQ